jgi:cobalt-zinc-cadmium efflux system membrane fusion protein
VDGVTDQALLATLPVEKPRQRGLWLFYTLIGILIGAAGDRFFLAPARNTDIASRAQEARAVVPSAFSRVGDRLVVPEASPLRTLLTVAAPTMKEVARTLVLPATVEADPSRTVKVMPPVTGRVIELKVQLGGRVVQGQELAVIDSGDLAQAYSDIEKARSTLTLTKKSLDRQLNLERAGGAAIKDREQAQSDYAQAAAELERSEARLRAIGIPADQKESRLLSIKAAVSGSVIDLQIAPGAFVNDPTAAMMTIANLDTIWVTASVPEKDIAFVFPGQTVKVTFRSYPDDVFEGKVLFVSDVVESDTRRNKVRIAFDNPDKILKPNMFADTTFVAPAVSRLMVPTSALLMTNDATSVFVEVSDWAFERRNVEIAYQEGTAVAIKAGIRPGERVVVKGGVRLND